MGKDDKILVSFEAVKQGENSVNMMEFVACNGQGLQISQSVKYGGKAEPDGKYIVSSSTLTGLIKGYRALGVDEVSLSGSEKCLTVKNGNGKAELQRAEKMASINPTEAQEGILCGILFNIKELQAGLRSVGYAQDPGIPACNGIFFSSTDTGYTLYATNTFLGACSNVKAEFHPQTKEAFSKDFFVGTGLAKALSVFNGEQVGIALTDKYLVAKDAEGTFAIITLNKTPFPVDTVKRAFVRFGDAMGKASECFSLKIKKSVLEAAVGLAETLNTDKEKSISFKAVQMGENCELVCNINSNKQAIPAEVKYTSDDGDAVKYQTTFLRGVLATCSDDTLRLRLSKKHILAYYGDSDECSAFVFGAVVAQKSEEAKEG